MITKTKVLFLAIFLLSTFLQAQVKQKTLPIIPAPALATITKGEFTLNSNCMLLINDAILVQEANYLNNYLLSNYGYQLAISTSFIKPKKGNYISLELVQTEKNIEGKYELNVGKKSIVIKANANSGIFYGLQSLIQLLPFEPKESLKITCCAIQDYPRYEWRGMHLDCSRHFFPASFIKKYIDMLAMYKMNVFHWHLTDDQGWRIEIKQYPKLTEIGAWRKGSMVGAYADNKFDSTRYGGFYTQNEINEIVAYASMNHITIVPEIEMPGHALAALAAYPEYSCSGKPCEVGMKWGVETNVFCQTEETFTFLGNILEEVISLFPGKYIHIGGDEVLKDEWNKSAFCLNLMKEKNLKDAHELQSYFITRIEKIVNAKGRMIIGWDEILEGGLAPNAAVMSWRGTEGGIAAAKQQHYVVMSPGSHCYFDHYQGNPETEPHAIGGFTPLEKVYSYEPTPDTLNAEEAKYILGAQANVWTEYITTTDQVEYMAMPRMAALAEVVWSKKENKNYDDFFLRIKLQQARLSRLGINYSKTAFNEKKK
jgi:hexosaminidase